MFPSRLILKNGDLFEGLSPKWQQSIYFGEVVFTTGMTGYVESLTDPSYAGQILTFTYPLIGNYGVPDPKDWEGNKIYASGVVIAELCAHYSHHSALHSLEQWLEREGVPLITGVDTRALTKKLRKEGVILGAITREKQIKKFEMPAQRASIAEPQFYGTGNKRIIAVDCGMKENILRSLLNFPLKIKRVPFDYDYLEEDGDGIFLSNGPGDPSEYDKTIAILKKAMQKKKPIFGICLGAQLLALASGAKTYKLRFGHRGHNQPCMDLKSNRCYLTSQNHGYAIEEMSLSKDWDVSWRNLNDETIEGIEHKTLPHFAVQFHPEAAPGPVDTQWLFKKFYEAL